MHRRIAFPGCVLGVLLALPAAASVAIDGALDPAYGPALVTQTVQTALSGGQITGDNSDGDRDFANGSELDAGFAFISGGTLHLFLAGNVAMKLNVNQNRTVGHVLDVFVDAVPGGQGTLNGLGAGHPLNGLTFDTGFEADYMLELEGDAGGFSGPPFWIARYAALGPGGGTVTTLGTTGSGGPGTLNGGLNPHGILATIDNRNVGGVTYGCNASSGAGVTTGIEWAIPLAAIGNPQGCVRITVILRNGASVSNQVLAPVPVGTCPLGSASSVNFAGIGGNQFFSVCPSTADVAAGAGTRLALSLLGGNPSRGEAIRVAYRLVGGREAKLQLVDAAGRVLADRSLGGTAGASGVASVSGATRWAPGLYWVRLVQGDASVSTRVSIVR